MSFTFSWTIKAGACLWAFLLWSEDNTHTHTHISCPISSCEDFFPSRSSKNTTYRFPQLIRLLLHLSLMTSDELHFLLSQLCLRCDLSSWRYKIQCFLLAHWLSLVHLRLACFEWDLITAKVGPHPRVIRQIQPFSFPGRLIATRCHLPLHHVQGALPAHGTYWTVVFEHRQGSGLPICFVSPESMLLVISHTTIFPSTHLKKPMLFQCGWKCLINLDLIVNPLSWYKEL